MKRIINYIWPVLLCFGVGFAASRLQSESMMEWYPNLNKSSLTPPNIAFPIAWSVIYLLMGLSLGRVLSKGDKKSALIWMVQLVFNFLWSILFFTMRMPLWGFVDILLLDASVLSFMMMAYKNDKPSFYMFLPYILWLVIATYLNGYILFNN
ncbi:TspO/MBR family protein [uncultured Bacteroides sp.]|uniref:TspO/MBR family protein n=1 Tax=uncultured Bacteroides sp. TaxID=162156 RepID=UPI002626BC40|nr:TspO/MBR family protein [uncultured Bacteroides sp.]